MDLPGRPPAMDHESLLTEQILHRSNHQGVTAQDRWIAATAMYLGIPF